MVKPKKQLNGVSGYDHQLYIGLENKVRLQ